MACGCSSKGRRPAAAASRSAAHCCLSTLTVSPLAASDVSSPAGYAVRWAQASASSARMQAVGASGAAWLCTAPASCARHGQRVTPSGRACTQRRTSSTCSRSPLQSLSQRQSSTPQASRTAASLRRRRRVTTSFLAHHFAHAPVCQACLHQQRCIVRAQLVNWCLPAQLLQQLCAHCGLAVAHELQRGGQQLRPRQREAVQRCASDITAWSARGEALALAANDAGRARTRWHPAASRQQGHPSLGPRRRLDPGASAVPSLPARALQQCGRSSARTARCADWPRARC